MSFCFLAQGGGYGSLSTITCDHGSIQIRRACSMRRACDIAVQVHVQCSLTTLPRHPSSLPTYSHFQSQFSRLTGTAQVPSIQSVSVSNLVSCRDVIISTLACFTSVPEPSVTTSEFANGLSTDQTPGMRSIFFFLQTSHAFREVGLFMWLLAIITISLETLEVRSAEVGNDPRKA